MNFLSPGLIAGGLTLLAALSTAFGYKPLAVFLNDPTTAATFNTVLLGVGGIIAGLLNGIKAPAGPAA